MRLRNGTSEYHTSASSHRSRFASGGLSSWNCKVSIRKVCKCCSQFNCRASARGVEATLHEFMKSALPALCGLLQPGQGLGNSAVGTENYELTFELLLLLNDFAEVHIAALPILGR